MNYNFYINMQLPQDYSMLFYVKSCVERQTNINANNFSVLSKQFV